MTIQTTLADFCRGDLGLSLLLYMASQRRGGEVALEDMRALESGIAGSYFHVHHPPASGPSLVAEVSSSENRDRRGHVVGSRDMSYFCVPHLTQSSVPSAFTNVITSGKRCQEEEEFI